MANGKKSKRNKRQKTKTQYNPPYSDNILATPIEKLALQENTLKLLKKAGYNSLKEVLSCEEKDFYKIYKFNKKNLINLKNALIPFKVEMKPSAPINVKQEAKEKKKQNKDTIQEANKSEDDKKATLQDRYIKINKQGKWGFVDRQGKEVVKTIYDNVFSFNEELCCVEKNELFGYINRKGEEVVPIQYDCACSFSEGLACVFKKDLCGYIDKQNNVIIDFSFNAGTPFEEGTARVKREGKWAEIRLKHPKQPEEGAEYILRWIN